VSLLRYGCNFLLVFLLVFLFVFGPGIHGHGAFQRPRILPLLGDRSVSGEGCGKASPVLVIVRPYNATSILTLEARGPTVQILRSNSFPPIPIFVTFLASSRCRRGIVIRSVERERTATCHQLGHWPVLLSARDLLSCPVRIFKTCEN
jgi:hypothetical protein